MERIEQYVEFIRETEKLKSVLRTAWTSSGRQESTAEHSWRLAMLAGLFLDEFPELNAEKVLMMCLIHDIGELYYGDISAVTKPDKVQKHNIKLSSVKKVCSLLPERSKEKIFELWNEYEDDKTPEAHLVKALDKAETIIQHNQGINPKNFDYQFNLQYGKNYFEKNDILKNLRELIDKDTAAHIK